MDNQQSRFGSLLTLVLAFPFDPIPAGQWDLAVDLLDRFFNRATEITAADAESDRHIAFVAFPVNF